MQDEQHEEPTVTTQIGPWAMVPAWTLRYLKGAEVAVYVALRTFADRQGKAYPRTKTIAERAGVAINTTRNAIQKMRKYKLIATYEKRRDDGSLAGFDYWIADLDPQTLNQTEVRGVPSSSDKLPPAETEESPAQDLSLDQVTPLHSSSDPRTHQENTPNKSFEHKEEVPSSLLPSSEIPSECTDVTIQRQDVEKLCKELADLIELNGSKKPTITKQWRDAARLLLDKDGRSLDQVLAAIRWCQNDEFWRGNILSMPTLRKQYDRLRLAAIRKQSESNAGGRNSDLGTDAHLERYLKRAKAREAEEASGGLPANLWDRAMAIGQMLGEPA